TQGGPSGSTSTIAYQTTLGRWAVVGLIMVGMVFSLVDRQIIALLVDPVKNDLGLSDTQFSLLIGPAFVVFYITFGFPFGLLADRIQRRHVIALGVAVWSVATVACGLAGSFFALAAARALVGAGEASLMPSSMSIMSDLFSRERLPFVTSIFSVSIHIGGALAMLIGGAILSVFDGVQTVSTPLFGDLAPWQLAFVLVGLPGLILAVVFLIIPEPQRKMSSAQSAADQIDQSELVAFIKRNRRTISAQFGVAALLTIGTYAFMSWTPAYLIRAQGLSSGEAALLIGVIMLVCGPAGTVGGGALSTWLMKKKNRVDAPWIVMMLGAAGSGVMGVLAYASPIQTLSIACLAIAILCGSLYIGVVHAALQLITPGRLRGRMAAIMLIVMTGIGATSGPVLVALITDYLFADPKMVGFSIAIIVALVGVLVCLLLGRNLASYRESYQRIDQSGDAAAL
ncbi:MAG: MFS transporter, partial [Pseudomonadota bacterium]